MDLTFKTEHGVFNYRVCAIILHNNALLATKNKDTPYYYLPGGRVKLHEDAESAVQREVFEELGVHGKIIRPLWLNQGFFTEDVTKEKFHELCIYYLIDVSETDLPSRGKTFVQFEGEKRHFYEWIPLSQIGQEYLYPLFVKEHIHKLPDTLTILAEYE